MNCIAAVDNRWAIGNKGGLLVRIPLDMKTFKDTTWGKVVVLGRKTLETFPNAQPLLGRDNIILSRNPKFTVRGATVVHDHEELRQALKEYASEDIFIIGGASIYEEYVQYCDTAYITYIDYRYQADAFFPNLDEDSNWEMVDESEENTCFNIEFTFRKYINHAVKAF